MVKVNQKIISKFKSSTHKRLSYSSSQGTTDQKIILHFPSTSSITNTGARTNVLSSMTFNVN